MQRFTTVLRKMQTSIFLLLVIVMDSIKSNLSVNFVLILWKEFSSFPLSHGNLTAYLQLPLFCTKIIPLVVK